MTYFDESRARLLRVEEQLADAPVATPARKRRRGNRAMVSVATITGALSVGGLAYGAVALLERGDPVPAAPSEAATVAGLDAGEQRLLPLTTPDPYGGLPWGMAVFRPNAAPVKCVVVGRVQGGELGVVGRDGAFGDDGRFHPLDPASTQSGRCTASGPDGEMVLSGESPAIAASGWTGDPDARSEGLQVAGCATPGEIPSGGQQRCAPSSLRTVKYGFAGSDAQIVTYGNSERRTNHTVVPGTSGAYLFVTQLDDTKPSDPPTLQITYRDGTTCSESTAAGNRESCP